MARASFLLAIVWQVCALFSGRLALGSQVGSRETQQAFAAPAGPASGNAPPETIYSGPPPKRIVPLIPIQRDVSRTERLSNEVSIRSLSPESHLVKVHTSNWDNVAAGEVHHVFAGRGPNGSLGVDDETARRHADRNARNCGSIPISEATPASSDHVDGGVSDGVTRHEAIFPRAPGNACLSIGSLRHTVLVIEASIGSPEQRFLPMLDTGSTNVWVVHEACESDGCRGSMKYDPRKSSTFHSAPDQKSYVRAKFVSGEVLGELGFEDFTIGGVTVHSQPFAMLRRIPDVTTNDVLRATHFHGMIGLAFPDLMIVKSEPLYERYLRALDAASIFSFYYSLDGHHSAVLLGGAADDLHKGHIRMIPVVTGYYWQVELREVWLGERKVCCDGAAYAIFDTGTAFNSMPYDSFVQLMDLYLSLDSESESGQRLHDFPIIRYVFGNGVEASLRPDQYSFVSGGVYRPAYMQINVNVADGPAYILGSVGFMPHYYTVFQGGSRPMVGRRFLGGNRANGSRERRHIHLRTRQQCCLGV
ncbi:aspartyl protease, putative [Babesia bigemina]|uniref:Aspartyl protease, putative n=1 Tax=Babesia bigemina TaxID=5866 RepID=A0A061D6E4_BABBI|nr:aspartyl protease, putative [Babesia bigemina]CDR94504.1 aspartyl protease, putative [Babesia bigemina]|eukprot:XP_012766690.1 aspartyl protease, putative [Babesia bigemina]